MSALTTENDQCEKMTDNERSSSRNDSKCMVLHDGRAANTPEQTLLHTTLKADDSDLGRRLQSWRLDIRLDQGTNDSRVRYPQGPRGRTPTE